jgi:hypothetical protein
MLTLLALPETDDDPVSIRVIIQPLVVWIWVGGLVMAFGTLLSAIPSRLWRRPTDPVSARLPDLGSRQGPTAGGSPGTATATDGADGAAPEDEPSIGDGRDEPVSDEPIEVGR